MGVRQKTAVLVPVKPFGAAKSRLAPALSASEREALARKMLRTVIDAAHGLRVAVIAPATANDVRRFALINGVRFLAEPDGGGLNVAVQSGVTQLLNAGYDRVVIVHSDLPLATDFTWLADADGIVLVQDRTGRGTNAISVPAELGFRFSFGSGSFERHCDEARRLGYEPKVIVDLEGLSMDVDEPADLQSTKVVTAPSS